MRFALWTVSLLSLAVVNSLATGLAAKQETKVRLDDSSRGDLAFGPGQSGPWRVARRGEALPNDVLLRTSASVSPCRLQIGQSQPPGGVLQLGPETQARLVASERKVVVTTGRIFLQSMAGWSASAAPIQATFAADSAAEIELGADGRVSARVAGGEIEITGEGMDAVVVKAGHGLIRKSAATEPELVEFTTSEMERLWASAEGPQPQAALHLRRAELFALRSNAATAADIGWNLYESKRLPAERFDWLFARLAAARQHERLIELAEERLRSGQTLGQKQLESLAISYDALRRPDAAHRARTNAGDYPPPGGRSR